MWYTKGSIMCVNCILRFAVIFSLKVGTITFENNQEMSVLVILCHAYSHWVKQDYFHAN